MSSQGFSVWLKDVLAFRNMKCDVPVMRLPATSPPCQFILLLNFYCGAVGNVYVCQQVSCRSYIEPSAYMENSPIPDARSKGL